MGCRGGRGSGFQASWRRFYGHGSWLQIRDESTWFQLQFRFTCPTIFTTIFATIAPRLGRDRASIKLLQLRRSLADRWKTIPLRSCAIFSSIAVRSRRDRGVLPRSSIAVRLRLRWTSGYDRAITWSTISRSVRRQIKLIAVMIMISTSSVWWRSSAPDLSTWRKIGPAIISLTISFRHVFDLAIAWTRVHAIFAALIRSDARQAATSPAINVIVWEHSPTRIKRRKRTRLNRGKDSRINYPYNSSLFRDTWRPTRAPTWPPCHLACLLRGPHASCHVASAPRRNGAVDPRATWVRSPRQPRLGPLATSAPPGPARHVSRR